VKKAGYLQGDSAVATPEELSLINKLSRRALTAEEVYVFSLTLCDNEIDRDFERFTIQALEEMAPMFVGKTGIFDHSMKGRDQIARIFECHVERMDGMSTTTGEPYHRLRARAYLPRTARNEDIILDIDAGIKKEVSVGCSMASSRCSICGADLRAGGCSHVKGRYYPKDGRQTVCFAELSQPSDAYEWSFVAVPAQPRAGVCKSYRPGEMTSAEEAERPQGCESTIKRLQSGGPITLKEGEGRRLLEYIGRLEGLRKRYLDELGEELLRLMAVVHPELGRETALRMVGKLDEGDRKSLCKAYQKQLDRQAPPVPQLDGGPAPGEENNQTFLI